MAMPESETSYRQSHQGRGLDYHDRFTRNPRRRMMWKIEQRILDRALDQIHDEQATEIAYLDFACGTGRVLAFVSARTDTATGVDISESMLEVAATSAPKAELISADITLGNSPLTGRTFDLITAFRFFPNAEESLRTEAISVLSACLKPGGRLILNNHRSRSSLRQRLVRLLPLGRRGHSGMSHHEVTQLVTAAGLEIEQIAHAGVVPEHEWLLLRPRFVVEWFERLATQLPLSLLAENLVYTCRRPVAETARQAA